MSTDKTIRDICVIRGPILSIALGLALLPTARAADAFAEKLTPFLDQHCASCHGALLR